MTTATQTNYTWEVLDRETIMEPMFREGFIILTNDNYPIGWVRDASDADTIFNGRKIMNVQDGTTKFINPIIDAASEPEILDPAVIAAPMVRHGYVSLREMNRPLGWSLSMSASKQIPGTQKTMNVQNGATVPVR